MTMGALPAAPAAAPIANTRLIATTVRGITIPFTLSSYRGAPQFVCPYGGQGSYPGLTAPGLPGTQIPCLGFSSAFGPVQRTMYSLLLISAKMCSSLYESS